MAIGHWKPILLHRGRNRKIRPKTFLTKESAEKWIKDNNIAKFTIEDLQPACKQHKFRVNVQE